MARSFSRVLEDLGGVEEDWESTGEPQLRVSARAGFMVAALGPEKKSGSRRQRPGYEEMPQEPPAPPQFSLSDLASRAGKATSAEELRRLRRQFAQSSHPDRSGNSAATAEMAAANRLIDDAIASLRERREDC